MSRRCTACSQTREISFFEKRVPTSDEVKLLRTCSRCREIKNRQQRLRRSAPTELDPDDLAPVNAPAEPMTPTTQRSRDDDDHLPAAVRRCRNTLASLNIPPVNIFPDLPPLDLPPPWLPLLDASPLDVPLPDVVPPNAGKESETLIVGTSIINLPARTSAPDVITVGGLEIGAQPSGAMIDGSTLVPGGPDLTISGTRVSLEPGGRSLVVESGESAASHESTHAGRKHSLCRLPAPPT